MATTPAGRGRAAPAASGGGRVGGRQESPLLPENTCQPKAGASMRCKNYRNAMLCLHNCKTVRNTAVNPHPAPSSLCISCHEGFPSWGWRAKCKSHLWYPLNNSFTLPDPRLCWLRIQGGPSFSNTSFRFPEPREHMQGHACSYTVCCLAQFTKLHFYLKKS